MGECGADVVVLQPDEGNILYCQSISEAIQKFIIDVQNGGNVRKLVVNPGTYLVKPAPDSQWGAGHHIAVRGRERTDVTETAVIDLTGVVLLMTDRTKGAICLSSAYNVHVQGGSIMYEQEALPFTQGTITAIAEDQKSFTVRLHAGYPGSPGHAPVHTASRGRMIILFDPVTRLPKTSVMADMYEHGFDPVPDEEGTYVIQGGYVGAEVGDFIAYPALTGRHAVEVDGDAITICDMSIHAGPCHAVCEKNEGPIGNTYDGIRIVPWPEPIGEDNQLPLVAVSADGIHCGNSRKGPTIRNCLVRCIPDDAIAIHGTFFHVAEFCAEERTLTLLNVMGWVQDPKVGDPITCYSYQNQTLGSAIVTSVDKAENCCAEGAKCSLWGNCCMEKLRSMKVQVECWPEGFAGLGENSYLENFGCQGSGFSILNNTLEWTRARGMMLKCCNGCIIGNKMTGQTHAGIKMQPEAAESGWLENIIIQNNIFQDVGYFIEGYGMTIAGVGAAGGTGPCGKNFTIVGNTFIGGNVTPIVLDQVDGVMITQNTFIDPFRTEPKNGTPKRRGDCALVYATNSCNIRIMNNNIVSLGPFANASKPYACDAATVKNWQVLEVAPPAPIAPPTPEPVEVLAPVETQ